MRNALLALVAASTLGAMTDPASARDGLREWSYDWDTRPRQQNQYLYPDRYYSGRYEDRRSLRYYCSLGNQTPRSLRDDCRRAGYW